MARAAGISAWGFLSGPVLVALLFGALGTAAISPLSSAMLARAERLDYAYLRASWPPPDARVPLVQRPTKS